LGIACAVVHFTGENRVQQLQRWLDTAPAQHTADQDASRTAHLARITKLREDINAQIDRTSTTQQEAAQAKAKLAAETAFIADAKSGTGGIQAINTAVEAVLEVQSEVNRLNRRKDVLENMNP
jgi:hypothetical protein